MHYSDDDVVETRTIQIAVLGEPKTGKVSVILQYICTFYGFSNFLDAYPRIVTRSVRDFIFTIYYVVVSDNLGYIYEKQSFMIDRISRLPYHYSLSPYPNLLVVHVMFFSTKLLYLYLFVDTLITISPRSSRILVKATVNVPTVFTKRKRSQV